MVFLVNIITADPAAVRANPIIAAVFLSLIVLAYHATARAGKISLSYYLAATLGTFTFSTFPTTILAMGVCGFLK